MKNSLKILSIGTLAALSVGCAGQIDKPDQIIMFQLMLLKQKHLIKYC